MKWLTDWLDDRTGYRKIVREILVENIPGGARWRYSWGSALTFAIFIQFVTGIFLWAAYSPSAQTAWESVYFIEEEMTGGWLLRGIHHYTAQVMTVLLLLHLLQVIIDGAYKAPREVNFWFGVCLLLLSLGLSLTGYLLPWDQKGYWATKVATNLAALTPGIGEPLQRLIVGGADYGHHTLTRFFALHAGVLPALLIVLIVAHIYLFRRHGITPKKPLRGPDAKFWPDQVLRELVVCLAVLAAVLALVVWKGGAELFAPADPSEHFPARPDWYFMFLFQLLKYFEGDRVLWGAFHIPGMALLLLCLMPLFGRWKIGHRFNLVMLACMLGGVAYLTVVAFQKDTEDEEYQLALKNAHRDAARIKELAKATEGIPPQGAAVLLHSDPYTQGPKIFATKCAGCHSYEGQDGTGAPLEEPSSAPDLKGVGSRAWLAGFMDPDQIETGKYFARTRFVELDEDGEKSRMVEFVHGLRDLDAEGKSQLEKIVAAVSADAELRYQAEIDARDASLIKEGTDLFFNGISGVKKACADCHGFDGEESSSKNTPDLNGWASRDWLIRFTRNPEHRDFYGAGNDRMPVFEDEKTFTDEEIALVVDWLREDWPMPGAE